MSSITIALDLYEHIFGFLSQNDLFTACIVSRSFRGEAERVLYRDVNLSTCDWKQVLSWSQRIADNPYLATMVHTLYPPGSAYIKCSNTKSLEEVENLISAHERSFSEELAAAIRVLVNLEELTTLVPHISEYVEISSNMTLSPNDFNGCSFRLQKCHLGRIEKHRQADPGSPWKTLLPFYEQKTEITDWAPGYRFRGVYPSHILPLVTCITICRCRFDINDSLISFLATRPIRQIKVSACIAKKCYLRRSRPFSQIFEMLRVFEKTLTHLYLHTHGADSLVRSFLLMPHSGPLPQFIQRVSVVKHDKLLLEFEPKGECTLYNPKLSGPNLVRVISDTIIKGCH